MTDFTEKRKDPRKPYFMPVDYADRNREYKEYILDISGGGIFIKTRHNLPTGTELTLTIPFPDHNYLTIQGLVVRSGEKGIAVRFDREDLELVHQVQHLVDAIRLLPE